MVRSEYSSNQLTRVYTSLYNQWARPNTGS
jgi:hypothetical protein